MISRSTEKNSSYIEGLDILRKLINSDEFGQGGWLAPEREMCELCNISCMTYRKALKHLIGEGTAVTYPRKGCYIKPRYLRCAKLGLVLGEGQESPFIFGLDIVRQLLGAIEESGFSCHLIQAGSVEKIPEKIQLYDLSGLIWFAPQARALPQVRKIHSNCNLPVATIGYFTPTSNEDVDFGSCPHFGVDYRHTGKCLAGFLKKRKHKNIAYIGKKWFCKYIELPEELARLKINFSMDNCIECSFENIEKELPKLILENNITAVVAEGTGLHVEEVFKAISSLPEKKRPELICRHQKVLATFSLKYPKVKLVAACKTDFSKIATNAVNAITRNIRKGNELNGRLSKAFSILPLDT